MPRYLVPLALFIGLAALLAIGLTLNPREVPSPFIGKTAPPFSAVGVVDPGMQLSDDMFKGKVTLFNVWASWCVACRQEHPLLVEFAKTGLVPIYGLNYKDQREDALKWLRALGNPYVESAYDLDGRIGFDWGVYGVPETFLVDQTGTIRYKQIGPVTREALRDEILPLIRELQKNGGAG